MAGSPQEHQFISALGHVGADGSVSATMKFWRTADPVIAAAVAGMLFQMLGDTRRELLLADEDCRAMAAFNAGRGVELKASDA